MKTFNRKLICIVVLTLVVAKVPLQQYITSMRQDASLSYGPSYKWMDELYWQKRIPWLCLLPGELLGYFSGFTADIVWTMYDWDWSESQYREILFCAWKTTLVVIAALFTLHLEGQRDAKRLRTMHRLSGSFIP